VTTEDAQIGTGGDVHYSHCH